MVLEQNTDERLAKPVYYNLFDSVDEAAEREYKYREALLKYPAPKTCVDVRAKIRSIDQDIDRFVMQKTQNDSAGNTRVQNRYIDGYNRRKQELEAIYNDWLCQEGFEEQQTQQFLENTQQQLLKAKELSKESDKTTTYVVIGMLILVVGVSSLLIFKK